MLCFLLLKWNFLASDKQRAHLAALQQLVNIRRSLSVGNHHISTLSSCQFGCLQFGAHAAGASSRTRAACQLVHAFINGFNAASQLGVLYEKAVAEVGEENAAIFEVHQMMLEDEDYLDGIKGMIRDEQLNAEYAVSVTGQNFSEIFLRLPL